MISISDTFSRQLRFACEVFGHYEKEDRLSRWMTELAERRHLNVAAVALANKTVRMAWAMMRNESDYDPEYVAA